jgi:REP element-mobilizing transposase RayT
MVRPLPLELSGGLYHVTLSSGRREHIYFADADREAWLALLGQVCARFNWRCHAHCQITNHYHLMAENAVRTPYKPALGKACANSTAFAAKRRLIHLDHRFAVSNERLVDGDRDS